MSTSSSAAVRSRGATQHADATAPSAAGTPIDLVHVGIHSNLNGNAGDTLLFRVARDVIERLAGDVRWERRQVWEALERDDTARINDRNHGVVVGGGGLLLRDQSGSDTSRSGWQWNASVDAVAALEVPLIVYGIGYNRFRGQPDFDPPFREHISTVTEKATVLGLRNTGSVEAVRSYLPPDLRDRPRLLHCPTTVLSQIYDLRYSPPDEPVLGVNFALDRPEHRFGGAGAAQLSDFVSAVAELHRRGWHVRVLRHKDLDAPAEELLDEAEVTFEVANLSSATPDDIVAGYRGLSVVAGMRGHGQLIPFGMRIPIVSVISHNKLAWFLDDIGHPEWGVELGSEHAAERLVAAIEDAGTAERSSEVARLQEGVWEHTVDTLRDAIDAIARTAATRR